MRYRSLIARYLVDISTSDEWGRGVVDMLRRSLLISGTGEPDRLVDVAVAVISAERSRRRMGGDKAGYDRLLRLGHKVAAARQRALTGGGSDA